MGGLLPHTRPEAQEELVLDLGPALSNLAPDLSNLGPGIPAPNSIKFEPLKSAHGNEKVKKNAKKQIGRSPVLF